MFAWVFLNHSIFARWRNLVGNFFFQHLEYASPLPVSHGLTGKWMFILNIPGVLLLSCCFQELVVISSNTLSILFFSSPFSDSVMCPTGPLGSVHFSSSLCSFSLDYFRCPIFKFTDASDWSNMPLSPRNDFFNFRFCAFQLQNFYLVLLWFLFIGIRILFIHCLLGFLWFFVSGCRLSIVFHLRQLIYSLMSVKFKFFMLPQGQIIS